MLRCILKNVSKYVIKKYFQIVLLLSKLFLSYFYATFKQWLQEVKRFYMYFSFIRLIPNFYDMYNVFTITFYKKLFDFLSFT